MWTYLENLLYDPNLKKRQQSSSSMAYVVGMVAAMGGFLYGYDTGLINDILEMRFVTDYFPSNGYSFNTHERALLTAVLSMGTFCGALVAPLISDTYGRKFSIILSSAIIFNIGNIIQIAANTVALLCVGRAVSGLSVGILSAIVPLYQAEASPKWVRGSVVFTYQWAITWGFLIASAVCQGTRKMNNSASYRVPVGLQFLWVLILSVTMLFLPESPRFHVQKNNIEKALKCLSKLRRVPTDDPDLIEELVEIKANYDYELSFGNTTILDCFRSGGGRHKQGLRMATGIGIMTLQQCTGINFIFYYGVRFFSSTGVNHYYMMSFVTYAVNVLFTIPGLMLIDVVGRRKLFLVGSVGMFISDLVIAILGVSINDVEVSSITSVSFSCVFIAFFAATWGGSAWALVSDIYGISIRQKAISITAATNWLVNFIFAYITPYLIDTGKGTVALGNKIFFIWGGCNFIGILFSYFMVYETKGLMLEEIDFMYVTCKTAPSSTKFKSQKIDYSKLDHGNVRPFETNRDEVELANLSRSVSSVDDYQQYLNRMRDDTSISSFSKPSYRNNSQSNNNNSSKNNYNNGHNNQGANYGISQSKDLGTLINGFGTTVIATPFFNQGPEDSDTDYETDTESVPGNIHTTHGES
ncbi:uncharacterized protein PRCAT00005378001 [Priceomyces carsonii]|uniref:uncharacterized protein n=1 Tax=Priceomyces carsonii TaxID=28549 RepID=UPI002ED7C59A|nr:unnamed protein product [Priceomyces carsonii]